MSQNTPKTIFLSDYEKPSFTIETIDLTFVLDETDTLVTNVMRISRVQAQNEPLVLHGENIELLEVILDDQRLHETQYELNNKTLTVHNVGQNFTLEIKNRINPKQNKALDGLYMSEGIFCTQNEPEGFRRITYYLDRPDVMALFTTKIIAQKEQFPVLLSDGNLIESSDLDEGYHYAVWEDPFVKPAYLYALVAGNLGVVKDTFTTKSGKEIALDIFCELETKFLIILTNITASSFILLSNSINIATEVIINQKIQSPKIPIYGAKKSTKSPPIFPLNSFSTRIAWAKRKEKNNKNKDTLTSSLRKLNKLFLYIKYNGTKNMIR